MYKVFSIVLLTVFLMVSFAFTQEAEPLPTDKEGKIIEKASPVSIQDRINAYEQSRGKAMLNEGFESGAIPIDWTILNEDGGTQVWEASTSQPYTGSYSARVRYETSSLDNDDWLITPPLNIQAGVEDTLKFWVRTYSSTYSDSFEVRLSTTGTNPADFTTVLFDTVGNMGTYEQLSFPLDAYDGNVVYVAIRYLGQYDWYVYADDFEGPEIYVPAIPIFTTPYDQIDLNASIGSLLQIGQSASDYVYITNTGGADLNISAINTSSADIATDVSSLTIAAGATDSVMVTWTPASAGIDAGWVEFVSDAGSSPDTVNFALHSVDADAYVVDFEADVSTWRLPTGYNFSINSTLGYTGINQHWGAQGYWKSGSTGRDTTYLWSPRLDLTSGPAEVGFYYKGSSTGNDDTVEVLISLDGGATYSQLGKVLNNNTDFQFATYDLSAYAGNDNVKIGWHYYYPDGGTSGGSWYMDDLMLPQRYIASTGELYASPDNLDFGVVILGDTSVGGVILSNAGSQTVNISSISVDNASYQLDGITAPATLGSFESDTLWVAFMPTSGGMQPGNITISHDGQNGLETDLVITLNGEGFDPLVSIFPYSESFENGGTIPAAWVNDTLDSDKDWEFDTSAGHGADADHTTGSGYFAYVDDSTPNPTDPTNLYSPFMDLTGLNNPVMEFYYWSFNDRSTPQDTAYLHIDVYDGTTWQLDVIDSIGQVAAEWRSTTVNLTAFKSTGTRIRFRVVETPSFYHDICIDDVTVFDQINWANLQWPPSITTFVNVPTEDIYGQVWIDGVTSQAGVTPGLIAELGYGPDGSMPMDNPDWTWVAATYNMDQGNNDEFMAALDIADAGVYDYAYRYSWNGSPWLYADQDGTNNGYDPAQAGDLNVNNPAGTQKLLISEIVVTPTNGEFIEIYNPNTDPVNLSDYYITDATYAGGNTYYYQVVEGGGGGGGFGDFDARFPDGAMIAAGEFQTVALAGDSVFYAEYGVLPTYELYEDSTNFADDVPDMREAVPGSINRQGGLTNGDEVVIMYYWDGLSDLVKDVDYLLYNSASPAPNDEAVDKTGVSIDGPDAGTDSSTYLPDTPIDNQVSAPNNGYGYSVHRIDYTEGTQVQTGGNGITGGDETSEDLNVTFTNNSYPSPNADIDEPLPAGVFLMEDFEDGTLPADWTALTNAIGWLVGDSAALSSQYWAIPAHGIFAAANDDAGGSGSDGSMDYLITPPMDFTGVMGVVLSFESFYTGEYSQKAYVEVSEDGGTTWTVVDSLPPNTSGWVPVTMDLSAYAGTGHDSVWVAFHADDQGEWASGWAVDNVIVREMDTGNLEGTVTVAASGNPLENATVTLGAQTTMTDASGQYSFQNMFVGMYDMMVEMDGYNVFMQDSVEILADSTVMLDVALTAPTMELDVAAIDTSLMVGDSVEVPITVSNNGDGPLNFSVVAVPGTKMQTDYSKYQVGGKLEALRNVSPQKHPKATNITRGDTVIVHHDGPYANNGIGTGGAVSWISAVRFTADELAAYYGEYSITGVQLHIRSADFTSVTLKVWEGGMYGDPGAEVYSQDITASVNIDTWTEITLSSPISLITGQEYWIGYAIDATADHPSSVDAGPMVPGKGAWMYFGGAWQELTGLNAALNYNWNIRGILEPGNDYWMAAYPAVGMVPAGGSATVMAKLDASVFMSDTLVTANLMFYSDPDVGMVSVPVTLSPYTGIGNTEELPTTFELAQNFPNPFNPTTTIKYQVPKSVDVTMEIFNILGQKVRTLMNNRMEPGRYEVVWDGRNDLGQTVGSGIYIYRIKAGDFVKSQKMMLMK